MFNNFPILYGKWQIFEVILSLEIIIFKIIYCRWGELVYDESGCDMLSKTLLFLLTNELHSMN